MPREDRRHDQDDRDVAGPLFHFLDHVVVDVVAQRVGDGQQQAVGGGERRREAAGGDQAGDHVGKARDLRCRQDDHVGVDDEVGEPDDAGMSGDRLARGKDCVEAGGILAADLDQPELTPGEQPRPDAIEIAADDVGVHLELRERRVGRRREVEQEDEQQRPRHRLARFAHRRGREVAHQDVRQRCGADHHAEDDAEEVERAPGQERLDVRLERSGRAGCRRAKCCELVGYQSVLRAP